MSFPGRAVQRTWHLVDAANQTVGRLATTIAPILKGKHKPTFRPNADIGDYVVIVNANKVCTRNILNDVWCLVFGVNIFIYINHLMTCKIHHTTESTYSSTYNHSFILPK
jgi:hypothetical protein